jgi:hypothetical protein
MTDLRTSIMLSAAVSVVSLAVGILGTLAVMAPKMVLPAPDSHWAQCSVKIGEAAEKIAGELRLVEGNTGLCVEEVQALRKEMRPAPKLQGPTKAAGK